MSATTIGGIVWDAADAAPANTRAAANELYDVAVASQARHGKKRTRLNIIAAQVNQRERGQTVWILTESSPYCD
jgi:hypothetical protein